MRPLLAAATGVALAACRTLPEAPTTQGREIGSLGALFFWAAVAVAVVVYGLILWSVLRYRRRPGGLPPQVRSNIPVEVVYTLVPVALVVVLFVLSYRAEVRVEAPADRPAATIHVTAFDWSWRFDYEGTDVSVIGTPDDPPEMVLPVGDPVRIRLTSTDVIHAFYVPDFLFKRDAIPGRTTSFDLTLDEPGVFRGLCAEFCGLGHYRMRFTVRGVSAEQFDQWLADREAAG
ncbi:MAG: cytochrome c oxidase subunit II [Actinomycetota bacterium]